MGAGKTRKKLNTKGSRTSGGGGGGATAQQIAYTDVTLAVAQAKQSGTGDSWTEGFYRVTGVDASSGNFYSETVKSGATVQLKLDGTFETASNTAPGGESIIIGKAHLNLVLGIIDDFEYSGKNQGDSAYVYQRIRTTNGLSAFDIGNDAYVWGTNQFNNFEAINPTITFTGVLPDSQSVSIQNTINSNGDIFAFTNDAQAIYNLNEGYNRTISFANVNGLTYSSCIIQSGKTITINSSQTGKYWVDTRSTFTEILDIDVAYNGGTALLDLVTVQHAGLIIFNSPTTASPTIKGFINWLYDGMTRTFQIDSTTNPSFEASPLKFPLVSLVIPPFTLTSVNDLAVITYTGTDFLIMADSNNY